MTAFIVEHQCPQCGAPARLQEADRLIRCPYCRVGSYLTTPGHFRYVLPSRAPENADLIWFPYWRLKGMLFTCTAGGIQERFVDVSYQAISMAAVPPSLGFRSQTQKLRFALPDNCRGAFLRPRMEPRQSLQLALNQFGGPKIRTLHQEYIGETLSLIYAPFYYKHGLYDALLNEPLPMTDSETQGDLGRLPAEDARWPLEFVPTLCPSCGWDLDGSGDSLVLTCPNCQRIWQPRGADLKEVRAAHQTENDDRTDIYLPFWRIRAQVSGADLDTYADLVKLANLPKVIRPGWEKRQFYFWSPAFKVRPRRFLGLATGMTLAQPEGPWQPRPPRGETYPVNLPPSEAAQTLKLSVARFLRPRQKLVSLLPGIQVRPRSFVLVYIPFRKGHHELINDRLKLALSKNMLSLAHNL